MNKELFVYFSTPDSDCRNLMAYRGVEKMIETGIIKEENWECKTNNKDSLPKNYNAILHDPRTTGKILCLVHSDLIIDDLFVGDKLNARFERSRDACMVGIAGGGGIARTPLDLELWHLMTPKGGHLGEVTNNATEDILSPVWTTRFGTHGKRAMIIDGCFMALDTDRIRKIGATFDEKCPSGFHFYDLIFSLRCIWAGGDIYVDPIHVVHRSIGLTKTTEDFLLGNQYFKDNYLSRLWTSNEKEKLDH